MITLTNSFHGTKYRTTKTEAQIQAIRLSLCRGPFPFLVSRHRRWVRKVHNTLCGITGCTCTTSPLGEK